MLSPKICPARPLRHDVTAANNGTAAYASHRLARRELRRERVAMTPSGMRGVLNDAVSIYFPDAALAGAFVARWCIGYKVETAEGAFRMREDEPTPRVRAGLYAE